MGSVVMSKEQLINDEVKKLRKKVSELEKSEAKLRHFEEALKVAEERFRAIAEHSPEQGRIKLSRRNYLDPFTDNCINSIDTSIDYFNESGISSSQSQLMGASDLVPLKNRPFHIDIVF